jgi:L-asparaginase/Glu-tRNA(Gln) amidotransferase subunit D
MGMMEGFLRNHDSLGVLRHDLSILFTGATVPIHGYTFSDAGFNMGAALCALKNEEIGISGICMNGSLIRNGEG